MKRWFELDPEGRVGVCQRISRMDVLGRKTRAQMVGFGNCRFWWCKCRVGEWWGKWEGA